MISTIPWKSQCRYIAVNQDSKRDAQRQMLSSFPLRKRYIKVNSLLFGYIIALIIELSFQVFITYRQRFGKRALLSPQCRIDIFKTQAGRLVVNEIETLEAQVIPLNDRSHKKARDILTYQKQYWRMVFDQCLDRIKQ